MTSKAQKLIDYIKKYGGVVRFSSVLKAGFHPDSLTFLEKSGKVEKIGRGLYALANKTSFSQPDIMTASFQSPKGVICLISALAFHEATTQIPQYVDLAIPRGTHANRIHYPPVKFYRFAPKTWKAGIEKHKIEGHNIMIYNLAKTIADCFKFRNRIGMDTVIESLKIAVKEKNISPKEIMFYAKICRVSNIIKPSLEAII